MEMSGSESSKYSDCTGPKATKTSCTNVKKKCFEGDRKKNQDESEEINEQNKCNKRNEKLSKPCQNGFCYCFTSDSDQHVQKRRPRTKSRRLSTASSNISEEYSTETSDTSNLSSIKHNEKNYVRRAKNSAEQITNKQYSHQRHSVRQNYFLTAKTSLDRNPNAPLIHIVQEIYRDEVISEVKINEQKMIYKRCSPKKVQERSKNSGKKFEYCTEETLKKMNYESASQLSQDNCTSDTESTSCISEETLIKNKLQHLSKGQLLKRRVSENWNHKNKVIETPPKKPPRRFSETSCDRKFQKRNKNHPITSYRDAEVVLNKFIKHHGLCFENDEQMKFQRKSYPSDECESKNEKTKPIKMIPSCPSISDAEIKDSMNEPHMDRVFEEVKNMLTYDEFAEKKKNFVSLKSEAKPQMGWVVPPKQDIDTVDGFIKPPCETENFHNFANHMDIKSTPIKSDFINSKQQKTNKLDLTPDNKKKKDLSNSITGKAKESTCDFFKNSAQKFVNLVSKISSKDKLKNNTPTKNVSCQTSAPAINETAEDSFNNKSYNKKARFSLQSPPGSYFSSSPKKNNDMKDFDFNRKINPPKQERLTQRRLSFSPRKVFTNFSQTTNNNPDRLSAHTEFYKSYQSEINGDFSLNLMHDILLNIKAKLEASDNHLTQVFKEVEENDLRRSLSRRNLIRRYSTDFDAYRESEDIFPTNVDVHNNADETLNNNQDTYSEIEEEEIVFTGSPSIRSLNEISHFYANNDPNSVYTEIKKNSKSRAKDDQRSTKTFLPYQSDFQQQTDIETEVEEPTYVDIEQMNVVQTPSHDSVNLGLSKRYSCACKCSCKNDVISEDNSSKLIQTNVVTRPTTNVKDKMHKKTTKAIIELFRNPVTNKQSSQNSNRTLCSSLRIADDCVVEDEGKTVKELVDYFETSLLPNDACNKDPNVDYDSPNDTLGIQGDDICSNLQEIDNFPANQDEIYYEICEQNTRCKSCPLPDQSFDSNRECLIANHSYMMHDFQNYKTKSETSKRRGVRYHFLKSQFRKSIRQGKSFFKKKMPNYSLNNKITSNLSFDAWEQSNLGLTSLFVEDNYDQSWQKQLEKAVFICRKLPVLESSIEAVEAERLLLYTKLKNEKLESVACDSSALLKKSNKDRHSSLRIEEFKLPIQKDVEFNDFFNFFYVGVFSDGHRIISTNYAEKHDKLIIFRNIGIIFDQISYDTVIKCDVYVLRLRKVLSSKITKEQIQSKMEQIKNISDMNDELLSRFKLQASFQLVAKNFSPLEINENCENKNESEFCMHASNTANLPIENNIENSLLFSEVILTAKLELHFVNFLLEGFLNIRSVAAEHHWNKRWCKVENFCLMYWDYPQDCSHKPPISLYNLKECANQKIEIASKDICPRPKSFAVHLKNTATNDEINLYMAADNQTDLNYWLQGLNNIINFKSKWM